MDEGYIKYNCFWNKSEFEVAESVLRELNEIRSKLIHLGMIGKIPDGPGFGNISVRKTNNEFYITGTNTGHIPTLKPKHLSLVNKVSIQKNEVWCKGLSQASSESLSHAVIYEDLAWVNAVIHVHHNPIWQQNLNKLPTTSINIAYGTVELANDITQKLKEQTDARVLILGGHQDGLISYGTNLSLAFDSVLNLF
jgi:ribulose-5-phosphate 4-epimerase/fuculose-1-phosphate aldolase